MEASVVVLGINNFKVQNAQALNFSARTRSERETEKQKHEDRRYYTQVSAEEIRQLQKIQREQKELNQKKITENSEKEKIKNEEKEYRESVKDLKDTQKIVHEITDADENKNIFAGSTLKKIGTAADILITGTLSGMALHWSTGKAFMMIRHCVKKPKIAKMLNNIKKPFSIVGNAVEKGASTAWSTIKKDVKATEKGRKFIASRPMKFINKCLNELNSSYKNAKTDIRNLTTEDIKSGISSVFGVSGFIAGVVEKVAPMPPEKDK